MEERTGMGDVTIFAVKLYKMSVTRYHLDSK